MIPYIRNPKDSTKQFFNLINIFSKVTAIKSRYKSQHTSYIPMKNILRNQGNSLIYNGLKNYFGVNPTKELKGLYN